MQLVLVVMTAFVEQMGGVTVMLTGLLPTVDGRQAVDGDRRAERVVALDGEDGDAARALGDGRVAGLVGEGDVEELAGGVDRHGGGVGSGETVGPRLAVELAVGADGEHLDLGVLRAGEDVEELAVG